MKLLKLALFAVTLFTLALLTTTSAGSTAHIAQAMEPASWILVGFGLAGGGFLHKRRLSSLNLLSSAQNDLSPEPQPLTRPTQPSTTAVRLIAKVGVSLATALFLLVSSKAAVADTINASALPVSAIALSPSSDTVALNSDSLTADSRAGAFTLQTGNFVIGDSEVPDQVISFSFTDTLTLNGITHTLTLYGQDAVTQVADTLTIFGGPTVAFGNELLTIQNFSLTEASMGDFPVNLDATVTPEPRSLLLLGTGMIVGALGLARRASSTKA